MLATTKRFRPSGALRATAAAAIPPLAPEAEASRHFFIQLRELRDKIQQEFELSLPQLSMGMTNDFTVAIEEGATHVRIGRALFS